MASLFGFWAGKWALMPRYHTSLGWENQPGSTAVSACVFGDLKAKSDKIEAAWFCGARIAERVF
jgi:hypothetical protein